MIAKYMRVSTIKQDLARQEESLKSIKADKVFKDKVSGATKERPALNELRLKVQKGDHVYFESISRLGRSVKDIQELIAEFKSKSVTLHFLKEGVTVNGKDNNSMANFLLNILSSVAELEREITIERVNEGIAKSRIYGTKSGKPHGRPPVKLPKGFEKVYVLYKTAKVTNKDASAMLQVCAPTFFKWIKIYEKDNPEKIIEKVRPVTRNK
jgi:DNA invertase Pin-like site-specific DNA recombinase